MNTLYNIAITKIPFIGPSSARTLISYCGGVREVFEATEKELLRIPGIGSKRAQFSKRDEALSLAEMEMDFIEKNNIQPLFYLDPAYPKRLTHYQDAPLLLFYRGTADLNQERIVAIVGTRKPSNYGQRICEELIEGLKPYGVMIISGLAYGIDVTAHRKSIESNMETVGVLGHGLQMIYPASHRQIAQQMTTQGGLLTEFTSKATPEREHFPMRNRIIAGMCDALIVVETARKGGSMISAEIANNYNKDVFAVPGRLSDPQSLGSNLLIKSHKAALIESAKDIGYIMRWEASDHQKKGVQRQLFVEMTPPERQLIENLNKNESIDIDSLTYKTEMPSSKVAATLLQLEFKGMVKSLPGKQFILV